jgi:hypothetical protein
MIARGHHLPKGGQIGQSNGVDCGQLVFGSHLHETKLWMKCVFGHKFGVDANNRRRLQPLAKLLKSLRVSNDRRCHERGSEGKSWWIGKIQPSPSNCTERPARCPSLRDLPWFSQPAFLILRVSTYSA